MADEFKKVLTDDQGGFRYDYYHNGKLNKAGIHPEKPLLVEWLKTNTPEEVPYVAPVVKPPPVLTIEEQRRAEYSAQISDEEFKEAVFEHLSEGRPEKLAALQAKREAIKASIK